MKKPTSLVVFALDGQRYALELRLVERIVPAVEITPLPNVPDIVLGMISIQGAVVPVVSLRRRLGLADREVHPADQLVIAKIGSRTVAMVIDESFGVIERPLDEIVDMAAVAAGPEHIHGATRSEDGLIWIHDLEKFLSLDETRRLDAAMTEQVPHGAEC